MSLENIIKKIKEQSSAESSKIAEEGRKQTEKIQNSGKQRLQSLEKDIKKEESSIETEIKNAILLPAKLKAKGSRLSAKRGYIDKVFEDALELSDADYKKVLGELFKDIPPVKSGTVLPAKGREKVTQEFLKDVKADCTLGDSLDGVLGGFMLNVGKVEYDCTFKTLLKKLKEKFETEVAKDFE